MFLLFATLPYDQIEDLNHPTIEEYRLVQDYLSNGNREELNRLGDTAYRMRNFKLIGDVPKEYPQFEIIPVNCTMQERENCILIYSSFNQNFPQAASRLIEQIRASDFRGHILYRLGGWPNVEGGYLNIAHVPYAFKVSFFKEAERLGYKRAFWLDTAALPLVSLNEIFDMIETQGYFVMGNSHMVGPFLNYQAAQAFGITLEEAYRIPSCSAGIFGVDFSKVIGTRIIDKWNEAAHDPNAFFSARSDQNALSIILYQLGATNLIPLSRLPHVEVGDPIMPDSLFLLDRLFVNREEKSREEQIDEALKQKIILCSGPSLERKALLKFTTERDLKMIPFKKIFLTVNDPNLLDLTFKDKVPVYEFFTPQQKQLDCLNCIIRSLNQVADDPDCLDEDIILFKHESVFISDMHLLRQAIGKILDGYDIVVKYWVGADFEKREGYLNDYYHTDSFYLSVGSVRKYLQDHPPLAQFNEEYHFCEEYFTKEIVSKLPYVFKIDYHHCSWKDNELGLYHIPRIANDPSWYWDKGNYDFLYK